MVPASVIMLALLIFTGFIVPVDYMLPWCRWINYVNPVAYGYESLMVNEFHNRNFTCSSYIPDYAVGGSGSCDDVGAVPGQNFVNGDSHINSAYSYHHDHKWRNVAIIIAMTAFNYLAYFVASEYITAKKSRREILIFRRTTSKLYTGRSDDVEKSLDDAVPVLLEKSDGQKNVGAGGFQGSTSIFHWHNVCYDVRVKKETRGVLENVDGWVKPGTLTALMGVSGAGKTTLLDCLADRRIGVGVLTGEMLVDGNIRDDSFQRKTGYAQQQDLHLETSTVREVNTRLAFLDATHANDASQALVFSALLRQSGSTPKAEKMAYVDEVIELLGMREYADAVVGVPGEGLNVEQRKRLTIGVELAAKPPLLLFVDEPTSGLDSQTS